MVGEELVEGAEDVGVAEHLAGAVVEVHGEPVVHDRVLVVAERARFDGGAVAAADMEQGE